MTEIQNNAAYIIKRIEDVWEKKPGKKILQKIVFLIEEKGIDLDYEYGLHFYGPYSGALDEAIAFLGADGVIKFEYSGYSHLMSIDQGNFNVSPDRLSPEHQYVIDELLEYFKGYSPSELELLTTAIYACNNLEEKSRENIINGVKKIKGSKYTREDIQHSLECFAYFNKQII